MTPPPLKWSIDGIEHIKVRSTSKEEISELKKKGAVLECCYFDNKGVKTYLQFKLKKSSKKDK